ncbi:MAG: YihY/virulence factor BrkB family protein [Gemmatimonadota bacterium]
MSKGLELIKTTFKHFMNDNCPRIAAALSYFTVFALPPLLILLLTAVGFFIDPAEFRGRIVSQVQGLVGAEGARMIGTIITAANQPGTGIMAIGGIILLMIGATGAFLQLQDALNTTWRVTPDPRQGGVKAFLGKRLFSLGMILLIGFLLLISFVVAALVSASGDVLRSWLGPAGELIAQVVQIALGLLVTWALFAAIFKILPDAEISWSDVGAGAFVTALLFTVGRVAIGFYLGRTTTASAFGAAAALAVLLIWIYYAAMILLLGAEFTRVWANRKGEGIRPEPGAIRSDAPASTKKTA